MTDGTSAMVRSAEADWQWQKPSFIRFLLSFVDDLKRFRRRRPLVAWLGLLAFLAVLYVERHELQPVLLAVRLYGAGVVMAAVVVFASWWLFGHLLRWLVRHFNLWRGFVRYLRPVGAVLGVVLIFVVVVFGRDLYHYASSYWRYQTLPLVVLEELPLSDRERIWPRWSVRMLVERGMNETEDATVPHLVRAADGSMVWTMAVQPSSLWLRIFDRVTEILTLSATEINPLVHRGANATFDVGESLRFSSNTDTCVRRGRWFWQAATTAPSANVIYIKNDAGQWVQVVPMIRWRGWMFPRPEFGGVVVVRQRPASSSGVARWLERILVGCGQYIPAGAVSRYEFLKGQNIVPYEVTRFAAESLRFRGGFFAPTRWRREGDLRIADLPDNQNQQPFALYFSVRVGNRTVSKIWHYVSLEPRDVRSMGLAVSYFAPADGQGPSYVYNHFGRNESLVGPTAVPELVRSALPTFNWNTRQPTEPTPYIRELPDARGNIAHHFFWLVPIVTAGPEGGGQAVVNGSDLVLLDASMQKVVRTSDRPNEWPALLSRELGQFWADNNAQ